MYKKIKIVGIIPARGGSKGIPNKNIIDLAGKPLIAHTIIPAINSKYLDKVIVSTDSKEIADIAIQFGAIVNGLRPTKIADDTAIILDVLKYEIKNNNLKEDGFKIIVLLQPTSPFRNSAMIDAAIEKFIDENQQSAVGVSLVAEHPLFMRTICDGALLPVLNKSSTIRRQDLPEYYRVNGMLYINYIEDIERFDLSLNDNISPIIIPSKLALDIDDLEDLEIARQNSHKLNS